MWIYLIHLVQCHTWTARLELYLNVWKHNIYEKYISNMPIICTLSWSLLQLLPPDSSLESLSYFLSWWTVIGFCKLHKFSPPPNCFCSWCFVTAIKALTKKSLNSVTCWILVFSQTDIIKTKIPRLTFLGQEIDDQDQCALSQHQKTKSQKKNHLH